MKRRAWALAMAGSVAVFTLSGCTGPEPSPSESTSGDPTASQSTDPTATPTIDPSHSPAPASTAPAPTPGGTGSTVSNPRESVQAPVQISATASVPKQASATLTKIESVQTTAVLPGEVSGPGLKITLRITNSSSSDLKVDGTIMTLTGTDEAPGEEMSGPPAKVVKGTLKPGQSATGVFVFAIAASNRQKVTVHVTLPTNSPVMVFQGPAPK